MMKRFISILLVVIMCVSLLPLQAIAAGEYNANSNKNFTITVNNNSGNRIEGATVTVKRSNVNFVVKELGNGQYEFTRDQTTSRTRYTITVKADGYAEKSATVYGSSTNTTITLTAEYADFKVYYIADGNIPQNGYAGGNDAIHYGPSGDNVPLVVITVNLTLLKQIAAQPNSPVVYIENSATSGNTYEFVPVGSHTDADFKENIRKFWDAVLSCVEEESIEAFEETGLFDEFMGYCLKFQPGDSSLHCDGVLDVVPPVYVVELYQNNVYFGGGLTDSTNNRRFLTAYDILDQYEAHLKQTITWVEDANGKPALNDNGEYTGTYIDPAVNRIYKVSVFQYDDARAVEVEGSEIPYVKQTNTYYLAKFEMNVDNGTQLQYTVTYTDGVSTENIFNEHEYAAEKSEQVPEFTGVTNWDGFTFLGWYLEGDNTGNIYSDEDIANMSVTGDMVFHAVWQSIPDYVGTVKVVLDGHFDSETQTIEYGQWINLETVLSEENVGVYVSTDGTEFIQLSQDGIGSYSSVLENGSYTIYYSVDNGQNYIKASNQILHIESSDRTRYLFYNSVTYDANGGTLNGSADQYVEYYVADSSVNVYATKPVRDGYEFVGWKDENGSIYQSGELLTSSINAPYKLTAQWIEIFDVYVHVKLEHGINDNDAMHNVLFTLDTREGSVGDFTEIYSKNVVWDGLSDYSDDAYTYFYSPDGKYSEYTPIKATLTNVPKANQYTVTAVKTNYEIEEITEEYDENGDLHLYATLVFDPTIHDFDFYVELDDEAKQLPTELWPKAVNVKVTCWYENDNDDSEEKTWHSIIQHYEAYERIELDANGKGAGSYPVWAYMDNGEPYQYRIEVVSYELQDGSLVYAIDQDGAHVTYPCERKRYVANVQVDGGQDPDTTDNDLLTGAWFKNDEQQGTVKAIVSIPVYTVTFVPNGGELNGSTENTVLEQQIIVPNISDYVPVRDGGYVFDGWYLADDNGNITGETVESGSALTKDLVFVAKWKNPITIEGAVTVATTYTQQNIDGSITVHTIHEQERIETISLLLQKQNSAGFFETIDEATLLLYYGVDDQANLIGIDFYSFANLPDDGSKYRIEIITPNYNCAYQNEPNSIALQQEYNLYNSTDFLALLNGDDIAKVNAYLEFEPQCFDLEFQVDSTLIGEEFRPDNAEILITYDDGFSVEDSSKWAVINEMIFGNDYKGYDVVLNNGLGDGSFPVWINGSNNSILYNYGIRLHSTSADGNVTVFQENPYFDVVYQAPAHFNNATQAQSQMLIAKLVPKTYHIKYIPNGGTLYGIHGHDHIWSHETKLPEVIPYREGYIFDGWYTDEELTSLWTSDTIDASVAHDMTFYAKWKKVNVHMQVVIDHTTDNDGLAGNYEKIIDAQLTERAVGSDGEFTPVEGMHNEYDRSQWHTRGDGVDFDIIQVPYIFTNLSDLNDYNIDVTLDGYYIVDNFSYNSDKWETGVEKESDVDENGDAVVNHYVTVCLKYDPELLDITFSVEMAEGVDKIFYPDYANVKITCWYDHPDGNIDLDWNTITQHTNDVIKVKLDQDGNGKGYGVCKVWQWLSKEFAVPYYYRFEVVSLELKDGTVVEMNEQQDEIFYTGGGYTSTIYADNGCATPVVVDDNGNPIDKTTSLLGSYGRVSEQSGPHYLQTGELRAVINMGGVVFHANNKDALCYDETTGNDIFRTYCHSDMSLPEGEYYNLNTNGMVDVFYDIPEFDYYTHNNYIFKGWYTAPDESGEPINWNSQYLTTDITETVHVYAHWIELGEVAKDAADTKNTGSDIYHEYDLMGVQIRDEKVDELEHYGDAGSGLRFITVLSESVYSQINAIKGNESGAEYGFVIAKSDTAKTYAGNAADYTLQYKGDNVNGINTSADYTYVQNMKCSGVPDHFNGEDYRLYTAVITYKGLTGDALAAAQNTQFVARSYIRYYDSNGLLRTYYNNYTGSQTYNGCNVSYSQAEQIMNVGE